MMLNDYDDEKEVNAVMYRQLYIGWNNLMRGALHKG